MENGHISLIAYMQSIDARLETMHRKLDAAISNAVSKSDCQVCKSDRVDKRYFKGAMGLLSLLVVIVGLMLRFVQ